MTTGSKVMSIRTGKPIDVDIGSNRKQAAEAILADIREVLTDNVSTAFVLTVSGDFDDFGAFVFHSGDGGGFNLLTLLGAIDIVKADLQEAIQNST